MKMLKQNNHGPGCFYENEKSLEEQKDMSPNQDQNIGDQSDNSDQL